MKRYSIAVWIIICLIFVLSFISCSSQPGDCTVELVSGSKTFKAKGKSAEDAKQFACNKYCLETDAKCDVMYNIWVNSPKGKAKGSPAKMRALSENKELLDCVTIECAGRCLSDIAAGKIKMKLNCSK